MTPSLTRRVTIFRVLRYHMRAVRMFWGLKKQEGTERTEKLVSVFSESLRSKGRTWFGECPESRDWRSNETDQGHRLGTIRIESRDSVLA